MDFSIATLLGVAENASVWANVWAVALRVVIVLLGVNMLVIVHEWGHFIVARMCGVRCDKFYIWFDAYGFKFFSFKRGDTEYGLGWLPLGGYVKMFGQEDNPGGIQAEIDRAKMEREEKSANLTEEEKKAQDEEIASLEKQLYAPDSYLAKNVFQRMAIISAGVIMNIIFAVICATGAAFIGTPETSAKIGYVAPGAPAWKAGLQPGDEIVGIDDNKQPIFSSILVACMDGKELKFDVIKSGSSEPQTVSITPRIEKGGLTPMIGVGPSPALELAETDDSQPYETSLDAKQAAFVQDNLKSLKGGERLTSMNGIAVTSPADYLRLSRLFIDRPIKYVFTPTITRRGGEHVVDDSQEKVSVVIAPTRAPDVGVRLTMGEIVEIQPGSVAEKAGLRAREVDENGTTVKPGDVILDVDNEPILDPLLFPYQIFALTNTNKDAVNVESTDDQAEVQSATKSTTRSITLTVNRSGERVDVPVVLSDVGSYSGMAANRGMLACSSLGVAFEVRPIVSGVDGTVVVDSNPIGGRIIEFEAQIPNPGVDASASLKSVFKTLTGVSVKKAPHEGTASAKTSIKGYEDPNDTTSATSVLNWFSSVLPYLPDNTPVEISVEMPDGSVSKIQTKVKRTGEAFLVDRGLFFGVDSIVQRTNSFGEAFSFGVSKTLESASQVFVFLKNVGKNVSAKALGGPGMIVGTAYEAAGRNDGIFLLFLCLISANLAVVNFLPIPVLDGGHMVFLLYEAIARRKPNEKVQIGLSYVGFVLILALMFWVIFLDIMRYCF